MQTINVTEKSLTKQFFKYLIPSVSAMWFFSIYTMVDGIFVGRGVGPTALAAVNLSMPFINTIFAISLLFSVGASTLITFFLGEGKKKISDEIFSLNILILGALGLILSFVSLFFLDNIALFLGATEETFVYVKDYLSIIIVSSTFFMVAYSLEVLVKADGFPIYSIVFVTVAAFTNIILDYILVIHFNYGVKGAAIATGASQFLSCIGFLTHFIWGKSNLKFVKPNINFGYIKRIITIGFPESLTELSAGFITFIFNFMILRYIGDNGVAAFSVIMYVNNLVIMTMIAVNQAMQPLVSYYNGKKEVDKIQKLLGLSLKTAVLWSGFFFICSQVFTKRLVSFFILPSNTEVFEISVFGLKAFSISFLFVGINIVLSGYFTALKSTKKATILSMLRGYIFITIAIFIMPSILGDVGIWSSTLVNEVLTLSVAVFLYLYKARDMKKSLVPLSKY